MIPDPIDLVYAGSMPILVATECPQSLELSGIPAVMELGQKTDFTTTGDLLECSLFNVFLKSFLLKTLQ